LIFGVLGIASLVAKGGRPSMAVAGWVTVAGGLLTGILIGNGVAARVSPQRAQAAVIILAMAGAVLTVIKGLLAL
jgi:uncharacterized membrane protein